MDAVSAKSWNMMNSIGYACLSPMHSLKSIILDQDANCNANPTKNF